MELRNRETHLRGKLTNIAFNIDESEKEIDLTILLDNSDGECIDRQFYSLAELKSFLRDWEEYEPEEPLIKDEKIRKAVRAWAEANKIEKLAVVCHSVWAETMTEIAKIDNASLRIVFSGDLGIKRGYTFTDYTIAELCGEEEE